ncbi:MAG: PhoPQ-activated pathogenicity-related family protein [Gammaproteobacteria bacterium]|nr:PhoPQ-activated pathogenicity-related family protein [Gammaproteobacteria bacterium]
MKKSLADNRKIQLRRYCMRSACLFVALVVVVAFAPTGVSDEIPISLEGLLKSYVDREDPSFEWSIEQDTKTENFRHVQVKLTSQSWLTSQEVDRTEWRHWLEIFIPNDHESDVALLLISGGGNSGGEPKLTSSIGLPIALVSKTIVAQLSQVPNQPLEFLNDGKQRSEDDLISFSWTQYLKTKNPEWLAQAPMVKSASRSMDAVIAVLASDEIGGIEVDQFIVAGGSKRGWTTWLTAVVDERVVAIVPVVFDVLNMRKSMKHHFSAYGFWSASLGDYVDQGILRHFESEQLDSLLEVVDPYHYLNELDIPKFIVNATGDEFFLLDSSRFYWDALVGPKYLRYVPNADHGMNGSDALESVAAFVSLVARGKEIPSIEWTRDGSNRIEIRTSHKPIEARIWEANNPVNRDFRLLLSTDQSGNPRPRGPVFASRLLAASSEDGQSFEASVDQTLSGWTAWTVEFAFEVGLPVPLKLSTDVQVIPTHLPFAEKDFTGDSFITIHCSKNPANKQDPQTVMEFIDETIGSPDATHMLVSGRDYYTWKQIGDLQDEGIALTQFLSSVGYEECLYQLEVGGGPTLPPTLDVSE